MPIKKATPAPGVTKMKAAPEEFPGIRRVNTGLANFLYDYVKQQNPRQPQRVARASGISNCLRQQVFETLGFHYTDEVGADDPHWPMSAQFGTLIHEYFQRALIEKGALADTAENSIEITAKTPSWTGHIDIHANVRVLERYSDGDDAGVMYSRDRLLVDIKTVKESDFNKGEALAKFKKYRAQVALYADYLGTDHAVILLVCRGTGRIAEYLVDLPPEVIAGSKERAERVLTYTWAKRLPDAEFWEGEGGSFHCRKFCPFYKLCVAERAAPGSIQKMLDAGEEPCLIEVTQEGLIALPF